MGASIYLVLVSLAVLIQAKDYCQYRCYNGFVNLGCKHSGKPDKACINFKQLVFMNSAKQLVLYEHNNFRSIVAKGQAKNSAGQKLPTAKNMNELKWNEDLAHLAYLNVLQCKMQHDKCRDTETQNGQNLFIFFTTGSSTLEDVIKKGVKAWFDEVKDIQMGDLTNYSGGGSRVIGHFTQVVWAESTHVGCAAVSFKNGKYNSYLMACNYVNGNMWGDSVYEPGTTCSACSSCTSAGLCKN